MEKERLFKKKNKSLSNTFLKAWLFCIGVFYLSIFLVGGDFSNGSSFMVMSLLGSVLVGGITFILLIVSILRHREWRTLVVVGGIFLLFFMVFYSLSNIGRNQTVTGIDHGDPLIDCHIHANCGGGTKRMLQSACVNSICCQVGNVDVVLDKDECKLKQQEYVDNNKLAPVTNVRIQQPVQMPTIKPIEAPICCKETCNDFTGTCTTRCDRSWFCY